MCWVGIRLGGQEYLGVLDTGAKKMSPRGDLKNIMCIPAIHMGDGHVVHSRGDCEVYVPMGSRSIVHCFDVIDAEAFDFVVVTDLFPEHGQILSIKLQTPYVLQVGR